MKQVNVMLSGIVLAMSGVVNAADLQAGKLAFETKGCVACHGADAVTTLASMYPILAGQHDDYLKHALMAYVRGARNAPPSANVRKNPIMTVQVQNLTPEDIDNISAWLATLPSVLSQRRQ
ncbi:c-type cytochrome [Advenella sp. RU8]|uniref:c-type cytochrome n=1 Tax=Advenella sp. RU8 TaxID=3399575 RepID=UPI003AAB0CB5